MRFALGCLATLVACISGVALLEHAWPIRGAEWLREAVPFGLALQPIWLFAMLLTSGLAGWWLLRRAKEQ